MFFRENWPAFAWALFVIVLCGVPGNKIPELTFLEWLRPDKIAHLVLFGIQSFLLLKGFKKQNTFPKLAVHAKAVALVLTIIYGGLIEYLQETVFINRQGDWRDFIANSLGALLGIWFYKRYAAKNQIDYL